MISMKRIILLFCCLAISAWSMSQNAGGMINRPKIGDNSQKSSNPKNYNHNNQDKKAYVGFFKYDSVCVDSTCHEVIPCKYDDARSFSEGLAFVEFNGEWQCINKLGRVVFSYNNSSLYFCFNEGLTKVSQNGKWGFINKKGEVIIQFKYDDANPFNEGLASVKLSDRWGYIDKAGNVVIPFIHNYPIGYSYHEGLAKIYRNGKWGFINKKGEEIVTCKYVNAEYFSDGVAWVQFSNDNKDWGIIDKTGHEVIARYGIRNPFSDGLASVASNGKYGFIDKKGHVVIPFKYDDARPFQEGLARIMLNHKYGFIDKTGRVVIPCIYENAHHFSEGFAAVKLGGKWGFIDKTGKPLLLTR